MYFLICRRSNVEKGLMWSICFGFVNTFTHAGTNTNSLHETESVVPSSFDKSRVFELVCFFLHPRHSCQQLFHWTSKTRKRHIEIKRKKKDTQMQFWPLSIHCIVSCQHWKVSSATSSNQIKHTTPVHKGWWKKVNRNLQSNLCY